MDLIVKQLRRFPFINRVEIRSGLLGDNEKHVFELEREYGKIPHRIMVQQFEMKFLDEEQLLSEIERLENILEEMRLNADGLRYGA